MDECYYQKALHRLRATTDLVTTDYMQFFMELRFRVRIDLVAEANTTSTIPHLPREKLLALPVWFPPRAEQDEIVTVLSGMLDRERAESVYLDELRGWKRVVAESLLTGELRVTADEGAA